MKKYFAIELIKHATMLSGALILIGCGGGGGGGESSQLPTAKTNPRVAIAEVLNQTPNLTTTWTSTTSAPTGYRITIFRDRLGDVLYGKQGALIGPSKLIRLQMNLTNTKTTVLEGKFVYQIYLDKVTERLIGAVGIYNDSATPPCLNSASQSTIPTTATINDSGLLVDGLLDFYKAEFRSGIFAHYCQFVLPPAPVSSQLKWSFEADSGGNFICIRDNILSTTRALSKMCFGANEAGNLNSSMRATIYDSNGGVLIEARN